MVGPCEPLITTEQLEGCCQIADDVDPTLVDSVIDAASFIAWALSGRRAGVCEITGERPGRLNDQCCPSSPCGCGCPNPSTVWLAGAPVVSVDEVRIAGDVITDFVLVAPNRLVRLTPERWPSCQLVNADPDDDDVLVVDYTWGIPLDAFGVLAVGAYTCELLKGCRGEPCALPERVTAVARQGVSFVIESSMSFLDNGRTGVPLLDQWLAAVNPEGLARRSIVRTPDLLAPRS